MEEKEAKKRVKLEVLKELQGGQTATATTLPAAQQNIVDEDARWE